MPQSGQRMLRLAARDRIERPIGVHSTMRIAIGIAVCVVVAGFPMRAQVTQAPAAAVDDPVQTLVTRLDLERYKATIKGLTQFGDRRQGTDRNRAAIDWIESQLKSYGCRPERIKDVYDPPPPNPSGRARGNTHLAQRRGRPPGVTTPTCGNTHPIKHPNETLRP